MPERRRRNPGRPVRWPLGMYGTPVPMREDRLCEDDIAAVARALAEKLHWLGDDERARELAVAALSEVFDA